MTTMFLSTAFTPNPGQTRAIELLTKFVDSNNKEDFFILNGAAGTGKTSLVQFILKHLQKEDINVEVAAPTGRAAKVISSKIGSRASTIHSQIYIPHELEGGFSVEFLAKDNSTSEYTVYFVDEASMVSDKRTEEGFAIPNTILADLINFVKSGNERNKIVFIGDEYQLPPIGSDHSPALSAQYLRNKFKLSGQAYELEQVMRQASGSVILDNAEQLRDCIKEERWFRNFRYSEVQNYWSAVTLMMGEYDPRRPDKIITLGKSNKSVFNFNMRVRQLLGLSQKTLQVGDMVMVDKTWYGKSRTISNGDTGIILSVRSEVEKAGIKFADAEIKFKDNKGEDFKIYSKVVLDVLQDERGFIDHAKRKELFAEVMRTNRQYRETRKSYDDPYLGAMHLRYGYAITTHKAQGGEWDKVILLPYYRKDVDTLNWLYTSVTRARKTIYSFEANFK